MMFKDGWATEMHADDVALSLRKDKVLFDKKNDFQKIEILENGTFGKVLLLDDLFMKSEKDGFILSEMNSHVPMMSGKEKKQILIIGSGDAWTAGECLKYDEVEHIDCVDIDPELVDACKAHLPKTEKIYNDPRITLHVEDGLAFIKKTDKKYDLIISTPTDPAQLSKPLFSEEFYERCKHLLTEDGIFIMDAFMPHYIGEDNHKTIKKKLEGYYKQVHLYHTTIPLFPGGAFAFLLCSENVNPVIALRTIQPPKTRFYSKDVHIASFVIPPLFLE